MMMTGNRRSSVLLLLSLLRRFVVLTVLVDIQRTTLVRVCLGFHMIIHRPFRIQQHSQSSPVSSIEFFNRSGRDPLQQFKRCRHTKIRHAAASAGDETEPDLFDYFDPLLSPHAYPNGISPNSRPIPKAQQQQQQPTVTAKTRNFGINLQDFTTTLQSNDVDDKKNDNQKEPDLFDYFDPLLSPHAYPNGISPNAKPIPTTIQQQQRQQKTRNFGINLQGTSDDDGEYYYKDDDRTEDLDPLDVMRYTKTTRQKSFLDPSFSAQPPNSPFMQPPRALEEDIPALPLVDPLETFDPTLSPHVYTKGSVPNVIVGDANAVYLNASSKTKRGGGGGRRRKLVGILLMDHGSRNAASNERLHALAQRYQDTVSSITSQWHEQNILVQAAHMEIARPTILEGLEKLVQAGVDEIVCHPYFLSPGRHVTKDIPQLVASAMETLKIDIPVVTTEPVGSNTDLMIGAIHAMVQNTAVFERNEQQS